MDEEQVAKDIHIIKSQSDELRDIDTMLRFNYAHNETDGIKIVAAPTSTYDLLGIILRLYGRQHLVISQAMKIVELFNPSTQSTPSESGGAA